MPLACWVVVFFHLVVTKCTDGSNYPDAISAYITGFVYCSKTFMLYQQIVSKLYWHIIVSESVGQLCLENLYHLKKEKESIWFFLAPLALIGSKMEMFIILISEND